MALEDSRAFAEKEGDELLGRTIAGRFHIVDRIGMGGMGTVYAAEQIGLMRRAALKILKKEVSWDPDTVTRFHREAKAMSMLAHPNTVQVFDFGETDDGLLFLAMEMLEGELLTTRIAREGWLGPLEAISITQQILGSLHEAHGKGIIHRDLKPDNIYLARVDGSTNPIIKVLDFGIAKLVGADGPIDQLETQAGTVFGTPRYMSPEQAQGKTLDVRSDLYGVGVLLYQMLVGEPPFMDEDAVVVMAKHIKERPVRPSEKAAGRPMPFDLEAAALKALEKRAERRFQSAADFAATLESCVEEAREVTERHSALGQVRWLRGLRHLLVARPYVVAAALLGAGIGLSAFIYLSTGRVSETATVTAVANEVSAPTVPAGVRVESAPNGARVQDGERVLGQTPLLVPFSEGTTSRELRLSMPGHRDQVVQIARGQEISRFELDPVVEVQEARPSAAESRARRATTRAPASAPEPRPSPARAPRRTPAAMTAPVAPTPSPAAAPPAMQPPRMNDPYERWD
jgi:serine/threonine-protein kinase